MLRYIFLKLSGFTSKKEFCISSSCNQMLMFRPSTSAKRDFHREGRRIDQSRSQHKRSYSFPSRSTKSCRFLDNESLWRKSEPSECPSFQPIRRKSSFHQNSSKMSKETTKRASPVKSGKTQTFSTNLTKNTSQEKVDLKCKYQELSCLDNSERYELEVARPRPRKSKSELIFNVFDYVAKDVDLTDYLQPSNLRPFGSTDNIYLPLLMPHKNIDVVPQNNPNYMHSVEDVDTPEQTTPKKVAVKKTTDEVKKTPANKLNKEVKGMGSYKDSNSRSKEVVPLFMSKRHDAMEEKAPYEVRGASSKTLRTPSAVEVDEDETHRPKWSKSSITIEPPPFLTKKEDNMYSSASFGDVSVEAKRSITNFRQPVHTPWPAYSDHVKSMPKKTLVTYPTGTMMENIDGRPDPEPPRRLTRTLTTENVKITVDKPKALKKEKRIRSNTPQRRTLSMEHVRPSMEQSQSVEDVPKTTKSSVYASKSLIRNSMTQSLVSLNTKGANLSPSQRYAKSYSKTRQFEPKSCKPPEQKKKYFLPSKVRLKPPPCITTKPCPLPPPCDRADDCLQERVKKLPVLKDGDCDCFEPVIPDQNPKLKRLAMKFEDEPRCCPCIPTECPCPPPSRADDCQPPKVKKLVPYHPGDCSCIEPPPMVDVPLVRLHKICVPEDRCYPPKPCVVETCEERVRADDCVKKPFKPLRPLEVGNCLCVDAYVPDKNPKIRRLDLRVEEPLRVCPCVEEPCVCPEPPLRADEWAPEKVKKLQMMKPKVCECIEPPPMIDVPLKRLVKKCIPEDVCHPVRVCPVEPCEEQIRADMCVVEKPKKLPKFRASDCECFEPHMPDQAPKLKRLHMKFLDEPRCCPCVPPTECPCPPPPRADECQPPKVKKLPKLVAKECPCIEPPPMVDVPLVRLQKVCVPEYGECYPPKPCVVETCEERDRADDCLKEEPKKLRPLKPKPCPCVDFRMKEAPKMKRLMLSGPDPPRICPVKICPPPDEICPRADECNPQKMKKLPTIKPGDCPCIDRPMVDVPPIPRLKCIEDPEELLEEDPCVPYPRADWGCWEYLQDAEGVEKDKCKKPKDLNYKQKRRFNTDSRNSINVDSAKISSHTKEVVTKNPKGNSVTALKYVEGNARVDTGIRSENRRRDPSQNNRASTLPRDMKLKTQKPPTVVIQKTDTKKYVTRLEGLNVNSSLPTIFLLKELETKFAKKSKENKLSDLGSIMCKVAPSSNQGNSSFLSSNVRNLSTKAKKSTGVANASSKSSKDTKDSGAKKEDEKPCPNISKCPHKSFILKNCPMKEDRTCTHQRPLVCCEKKPSPNQAFSECMDEEIQPFSNTSQWTCNKKEYGFEPNPKKLNEPLDTVRSKKFSTCAADKPIVDYFSARYSRTETGQSRKHGDNVIDRLVKSSSGRREPIQRNSSTLTDAMSDVTGCRPIKKDFVSMEQQRPKLLNQKANHTVAKVTCRKISTLDKANEDSLSVTKPPQRAYSTDDKTNHRSDCKFPKKKSCPKFEMDNCPPKERHSCTHKYIPPVTPRAEPPYPSFSELVDDDLEEKLTECPMDREKVEELQPHYMARYEKKEILPPIEPYQGRIDPKIEEQCIRERLCLKNEGLTQDCGNFGAYVKPLKSKNFFKPKNSDCEKIEELKKIGKWPPKFAKKFSTCATFTSQTRNMSSFAHMRKQSDVGNLGSRSSKKFCVRTFHALCKKTQSSTTGEMNKKPLQNHVVDLAASFRGLRNIQWRTDNFQKWHRLRKMSNHQRLAKKYHSCSKLKYRRFVNRRKNTKTFTTCVGKTRVANLNVRGVVCSKLKHKKLEKHRQAPKHLSLSSVKTPVRNDSKQRSISTTKTLDKTNKQKLIRFPLYPKPIKQTTAYKVPNSPSNMKRVGAGGETRKGKKDKKGNNHTWQPKYPSAPEVDTVAIPPYQTKMESNWEKECLIHFSGEKKKGKSWDCSAVEKPFIRLNSSNFVEDDCPKQEAMPCITCGEVFMRHNPVHTNRRKQAEKCPKFPNPCESRQLPEPPEYPEYPEHPTLPDPCDYPPLPSQEPKKIKQSYRLCPDISPPNLTLWEKIVNYFKAKPNCPGPDEWKKKALREKAEKAARAAGLCLCEPDSPEYVPEKTNERHTKINGKDESPPTRKGLYRTTTRHYSSGVNFWNTEELNKLIEEEKKKQLTKKPSKVVMEEPCQDDDVSQKCPDPLLESVFKEAILSRNSLSCLEKPTDLEPKDECVKYSLNIVPSDLNFLVDCIKESSVEGTKFESKYISDIQEYFSKIDSLTEITFEELEKAKTKNLVKELDKLLKQGQKPHKKS